MKLRKNDEVIVIAGKHKGKSGAILKINVKKQVVTIKDVNIVTKHVKPTQQKNKGGIENFEAPIHISNMALAIKSKIKKQDPTEYTKVGYTIKNNKKIRISKKTGKAI